MKKQGKTRSSYGTFVEYLSIMHDEAINLLGKLKEDARDYILNNFFQEYYGTPKEHYWSITKLFRHAMYIPMFLQIGKANFKELVYVDTHSGPGLAKIGREDHEIVLGSPLIALRWPQIVASRVNSFRSIIEGFTRLYFIEKSNKTCGVLSFLKNILEGSERAAVIMGDANKILGKVEVSGSGLTYIFVDPYGKLDSQLSISALEEFLSNNRRVDIMMSLFTINIARGLSELKDSDERLKRVFELLGDNFCDLECAPETLCKGLNNVGSDDVLNAFECALNQLGLHVTEPMPVEFEKGTLYYTILASTHRNAEWIHRYVEYINVKSPKKYQDLKRLWLRASKKVIGLNNWQKKSQT